VSNIIDGYTISFWPQQTDYPPLYLCDSDITNVISASSIIGLAFVFYEDDPIVGEVSGVSNTYVVSSRFNSSQMLIQHSTSFSSFPSRAFPLILPSCFPSTMFKQLLSIKRKVQTAINTRSINARNRVVCTVENIDVLTWRYLMQNSPAAVVVDSDITKWAYIEDDNAMVRKQRCRVETCI